MVQDLGAQAQVQRTLGDYEVIKQIGQGTLGAVLLAEHRFMKRQFALKVLPQELVEDRAFIQRFQEEVGRLATLDHPHIVKIHNVSFAEGSYFLVCDCVVDGVGETCNLGQYLRTLGREVSETEALRILTQVAEALDYAHTLTGVEGGLVHRGLKLNNVLIGATPKLEIDVQLSDFGLSRIIGIGTVLSRIFQNLSESSGPMGDAQVQTASHHGFLQNYMFLSPEQKWPERAAEVGVAADSYAFGILIYHLLTGKYPEGVFEPIADLRSELQHNWDSLLRSCLQSRPSLRPISLVAALEAMGTRTRGASVGAEMHASPSQFFVKMDGVVGDASSAPKPKLETRCLERPNYDADPAAVFQIDGAVTAYQPDPLPQQEKIEPILSDMVILKGGTFSRGSADGNRDEMPVHEVRIESFALDIHPVTNEQFLRFLDAMGGEKEVNNLDIIRLKDARIRRTAGAYSIESGYSKHPVVGVTWYGAVAYARWVGKRLPTEVEWEIAARGPADGPPFPTGDSVEKSQANFFSSDTTPVMSYAPNSAGLYDMAGNVYEWCQDWYGYNYYETSVLEPDNPTGPLQGVYRVLRGGCWKSLKDDLRCAHRHRNNPGTVNSTCGFRCAAEVR